LLASSTTTTTTTTRTFRNLKSHSLYSGNCNNFSTITTRTVSAGEALLRDARFDDALELATALVDDSTSSNITEDRAHNMLFLARVQWSMSHCAEAAQSYSAVLRMLDTESQHKSDLVARSFTGLAAIALARGQLADSRQFLDRTFRLLHDTDGEGSAAHADALVVSAELLSQENRPAEATAAASEAIALSERHFTRNSPQYALASMRLALAYQTRSRLVDATKTLMQAVRLFDAQVDKRTPTLSKRHPYFGLLWIELGKLCCRQQQLEMAKEALVRGLAALQETFEPNSPSSDNVFVASAMMSLGAYNIIIRKPEVLFDGW
jgi:tetratricopeptide (TPR) repeat protein